MTKDSQKIIKLYNTKSRSLEVFKSIHEGVVGIYSCGPTVYHYAHIGNLRAYVFADTLNRLLRSSGYVVNHIINITDVGHLVGDGDDGQDKLEKGAAREGKTVWEIATMYTDAYFKDLESLGINLAEYTFPRATDHIQEQISLVEKLEHDGYTYRINDGIYFDTSKFSHYADFAKLNIDGQESGARITENKEKRNITDFALWKFSPTNEKRQMEWDSPWGIGFPGWHIECSAMSKKYLGTHFDIHTGGVDHIPVHHTNEIAQSECAHGETYANYWMHVNFLHDTTGKMSKSNDDFLTLSTLIKKGYNPLAYRYFLMTAHYRKELSFSFEALDAAAVAYNKLASFVFHRRNHEGAISLSYMETFKESLRNDLSTPGAVATMWGMVHDDTISEGDKYITLLAMSDMLGLDLGIKATEKNKLNIPEEVQVLLEERAISRSQKDFKRSDDLRNQIEVLGFTVKDTPDGQELSK